MARKPLSFDFDISAAADKKRRSRRRGMSGAVETSSRVCQKEGCDQPGKYRAPKSPDHLEEYIWFCLEHVRQHNKAWNFFEGRSKISPEQAAQEANTWERPTRPMRDAVNDPEAAAWARFGFDNPREILGDNATKNPTTGSGRTTRRLPATETKALAILDAADSMTKSEIRKVYKALVKDLHPDLNGGRRDDEDRLTEVVWAWEQIKASRLFKP